MSENANWRRCDYQRIVAVERRADQIVTRFEDGSCASVDAQRVLPPHARQAYRDRMTFNSYEIVVPSADGEVEIPWSTIRALTDKAYSSHLAAAAEQQARQIGLRIKELRQARGLTGKDLAERAGIAPQSLSRIEHGRHDVVFTTLQRILAAMGCTLKDLTVSPAPTGARQRGRV
jgi:DNA-binding Xre family transcriptional regulator